MVEMNAVTYLLLALSVAPLYLVPLFALLGAQRQLRRAKEERLRTLTLVRVARGTRTGVIRRD